MKDALIHSYENCGFWSGKSPGYEHRGNFMRTYVGADNFPGEKDDKDLHSRANEELVSGLICEVTGKDNVRVSYH